MTMRNGRNGTARSGISKSVGRIAPPSPNRSTGPAPCGRRGTRRQVLDVVDVVGRHLIDPVVRGVRRLLEEVVPEALADLDVRRGGHVVGLAVLHHHPERAERYGLHLGVQFFGRHGTPPVSDRYDTAPA